MKEIDNVSELDEEEIKLEDNKPSVASLHDYEKEEFIKKMDKLGDRLTKLFLKKFEDEEKGLLSNKELSKIAEYVAMSEKAKSIVPLPDKDTLQKDINKRKKELLKDPFFLTYCNVDLTPKSVKNLIDHTIRIYDEKYDKLLFDDEVNVFHISIERYQEANKCFIEEDIDKRLPFIVDRRNEGSMDYDTLTKRFNQRTNIVKDKINRDQPYTAVNILEAADYVIACTLKTKAAKNSLFERIKIEKDGKTEDDIAKLNEHAEQMREDLLKDPKFMNLLMNKTPRGKLYEKYIESIKKDIDHDLGEQNKLKTKRKTDVKFKDFEEEYLNKTTCTIGVEEYEAIVKAYDELTKINKGKDPSKYMKALTSSCQDFLQEFDNGDGVVSAKTLDKFNKAALNYYNERKGTLFGPSTGKGQARLKNVEGMIRITGGLMNPINDKIQTEYNKEVKKVQAKSLGM